MKKAIKEPIVAIAAGLFALVGSFDPAVASHADQGYISAVYATSNGAILFNTSGARTALPGCQPSGLSARFALDASTVAGQSQVAVLMNAYIQHKRIEIEGTGSCSIWSDTETVTIFVVED